MILCDTSVWIDWLRARDTPQTARLEECMRDRDIVLGDLIVAEVLQGAKGAREFALIESVFEPLIKRSLCNPDLAVKAAANFRALRSGGVTIRGTIDVIIATWCLENRVPLLHSDRDFAAMEAALGLPTIA